MSNSTKTICYNIKTAVSSFYVPLRSSLRYELLIKKPVLFITIAALYTPCIEIKPKQKNK